MADYLSFDFGFFLGLGGWCRVVFWAALFWGAAGSSLFAASASFFRWAWMSRSSCQPDTHGVVSRSHHIDSAYARHARQLVGKVQGGVVAEV